MSMADDSVRDIGKVLSVYKPDRTEIELSTELSTEMNVCQSVKRLLYQSEISEKMRAFGITPACSVMTFALIPI